MLINKNLKEKVNYVTADVLGWPKRMHVLNQDWEKITKRGDDFPIGKVSSTDSKEN